MSIFKMIKMQEILLRACSLIIINFDEHGGFADHVPPPVNIPAPEDGIKFKGMSDKHNVTYDFTRLGVRLAPSPLCTYSLDTNRYTKEIPPSLLALGSLPEP